jgi:hypothetical protein
MNEPRDTVVGDALRRLDVPDHAPEFWDRLDAELSGPSSRDEEDHDTEADAIELGAVRPLRRPGTRGPSRFPVFAAAAAVIAAIALVGVAALQPGSDDESQVDSANTPDGSVTPDPDAPVTPDTTAPTPSSEATPDEIAAEWLTLLRDGEVEQAYELLDENSQATLTLDGFREIASALAEGAGSFADLEPTAVPLIDDEGLAATAVVFSGDVEREGMIETASYAVVVTGDPDDAGRPLGVAFTVDGPRVEAVPRTQPSETRTSPLELDVSGTAGATWALVDASDPARIDSGQPTVTIDVEAIAGPGTHTVTVISTEGGLYTARSFTVVVP